MSSSPSQRMKIGDFLLRRLNEAGVRHLFGVPSDYNLALLQQLQDTGALKCRGVILQPQSRNASVLQAMVWLVERLPPAIVEEIENVLGSDCCNSLIVCVRNGKFAPLVGRTVADYLGARYGAAWLVVEWGDERKAISVESDGERSWVVQ